MTADRFDVFWEESRLLPPLADRASDRIERVRGRLDDAVERRLREPIRAIAAEVRLLTQQMSELQREKLVVIDDAVARADGMVADLLNFVRASAGGIVSERRSLNLGILCERIVDAMATAHPRRSMRFVSDRDVEGEWDPDALETLVSRLVRNAIDHGAAESAVRVRLRRRGATAILEVWNEGCVPDGIARDRLFEPFVSHAVRSTSGRAGLGLGLYVAREIARGHGGDIEIESDAERGTTFRVTLPRFRSRAATMYGRTDGGEGPTSGS